MLERTSTKKYQIHILCRQNYETNFQHCYIGNALKCGCDCDRESLVSSPSPNPTLTLHNKRYVFKPVRRLLLLLKLVLRLLTFLQPQLCQPENKIGINEDMSQNGKEGNIKKMKSIHMTCIELSRLTAISSTIACALSLTFCT